jgi:antitoxin (DNA-binding transcriptional repressor) of toxin-antitoxin stability system
MSSTIGFLSRCTPTAAAQEDWSELLATLEAESNQEEWLYNRAMADDVIHISEAEAASDFAGLLARVRAGAEVVIESGKLPVAVIHAPIPRAAPSPSASRSYPRTRPRSWMLTLLRI